MALGAIPLQRRTRRSERAAIGRERGLRCIQGLLAGRFHGRLRRRILRHVDPRLARLVDLRLVHRALCLGDLGDDAAVVFGQEVVAGGDTRALRVSRGDTREQGDARRE